MKYSLTWPFTLHNSGDLLKTHDSSFFVFISRSRFIAIWNCCQHILQQSCVASLKSAVKSTSQGRNCFDVIYHLAGLSTADVCWMIYLIECCKLIEMWCLGCRWILTWLLLIFWVFLGTSMSCIIDIPKGEGRGFDELSALPTAFN